jgi:MFS family permease
LVSDHRRANGRFGVLSDHDFRRLFAANTISQLGTQVTMLALPLVAVIALHASALEVGVLAACETAAFLLVGLPAGAWVDRMRRREVLIAGDLGRAIVLGSVPFAWWMGALRMPQLYVVALLTGVLTVFFDVAYQSYLPHLVGKEHLVEGNAKLEIVHSVAHLAGPSVGGLLVQALTAPVAIVVDALSFLGSAIFVGLIRKREERPARRPDAHLGREIAEGLRFVAGNRLLRSIAACTGSANLFGAILSAMLILYLARDLSLKPGIIGLFFSMFGLGALVGAFAAAPVARWLGQGPAIWGAALLFGLAGLVVPLAEPGWRLWLAAAGGMITGTANVIYNVTQVSFRQGLTPDRLLGRMNGTMRFLVWGTAPLGGLIGGLLGTWFSVHTALWIGAIGSALAFLPVFLSPLRSMRSLESPATPAVEEAVA